MRYPALMCAAALSALCLAAAGEGELEMLAVQGDLRVHDPTIIREGDTFYVFSTGGRRRGGIVPIRRSTDLMHWELCGQVFENVPEWVADEIEGVRGIWAPDISYFNGRYHLYYSVSTFGRNDSAIGLATNSTLDPESPEYEWVDQGMVVRSRRGRDDWNAIDANIAVEEGGKVWLAWGSFWSGIKMRRIDPATGGLCPEDETLYSLAERPRGGPEGGVGAVEAPFLMKQGAYWYLFVSFDLCCRGGESTYRIMVGRSRDIRGPYVDREGDPMTAGGGTLVLAGTGDEWKGPGHCDVLQDEAGDFLVFHAYSAQTGRSELKISPLAWEDGWPRAAPLP